jgi:hypothetical protein
MRHRPFTIFVSAVLVWTAAVVTLPGRHDDVVIPRILNPPVEGDLKNLPGDLAAVPVPMPANLGEFVRDPETARVLGKALFWDMQVGSDGVQACATCHFRAGADPRSRNQVNPGMLVHTGADRVFTSAGPNGQLEADDFPLTRLAVQGVRGDLDPLNDSNDVVSSQGVPHLDKGIDPLGFVVGGLNARRVEPRNTPTVINAVFNHRQFWDGRADSIFNGVNHLGRRDPDARLFRAEQPTQLEEVRVELDNASLAKWQLRGVHCRTSAPSSPGRRERSSSGSRLFARSPDNRSIHRTASSGRSAAGRSRVSRRGRMTS